MKPLYIIPARGGSKGIPGKNIKPLAGKPLIAYSVDCARKLAVDDRHVIVSTDSPAIAAAVEAMGLKVPFMRPAELATDSAGSREVILHAMDYADGAGIDYDCVVLMQPTSPLRTAADVSRCLDRYESCLPGIDMVVTVTEASTNPYLNCYEHDADGYLRISKGDGRIKRRQDAPDVWEFNGAVYVINPASIRTMTMGDMPRRRGVIMPRDRSVDLDTPLDWIVMEAIINSYLPKTN